MEDYISLDIGAVAKRWKFIVVFAVVFAVLFYSYASFFQRPSYKNSKVYVIVNNVYAADQSASMSDISVSRSLAETYCGMIRMSEMMQQLADYLSAEKEMDISYQALRSCISVDIVDQTESIRISVTTGDIDKTRIVSEAVESFLIPTVSRAYGSAEIKRFGDEIDSVNTPNVVRTSLVGFVLGAILSVAVLLLFQIVYNRITDEDDFSKKTDLPLLGVIPDPTSVAKGDKYEG